MTIVFIVDTFVCFCFCLHLFLCFSSHSQLPAHCIFLRISFIISQNVETALALCTFKACHQFILEIWNGNLVRYFHLCYSESLSLSRALFQHCQQNGLPDIIYSCAVTDRNMKIKLVLFLWENEAHTHRGRLNQKKWKPCHAFQLGLGLNAWTWCFT